MPIYGKTSGFRGGGSTECMVMAGIWRDKARHATARCSAVGLPAAPAGFSLPLMSASPSPLCQGGLGGWSEKCIQYFRFDALDCVGVVVRGYLGGVGRACGHVRYEVG